MADSAKIVPEKVGQKAVDNLGFNQVQPGFLALQWWSPWYKWNVFGCGVKHQSINKKNNPYCSIFIILYIWSKMTLYHNSSTLLSVKWIEHILAEIKNKKTDEDTKKPFKRTFIPSKRKWTKEKWGQGGGGGCIVLETMAGNNMVNSYYGYTRGSHINDSQKSVIFALINLRISPCPSRDSHPQRAGGGGYRLSTFGSTSLS